jgi:3,4-dihydroxy 2-butanone 4-phosphate synthase/GTP cyclohydrolase II
VLVRVHAVHTPADLLGIGLGARGSLVEKTMLAIAQEGRGVLVLIRDLRPKSVSAWVAGNTERKRPRKKIDPERRLVEIGIGSQILRALGVSDMILLSNAPPSRYVGLEAFGLRIVGQRRIG